MGSNSSKPSVPKRKKGKPKYSRVLVKTISNSNIQEVALAVIDTQSTIERNNRRLSNVPAGSSAQCPPPRPKAPKPTLTTTKPPFPPANKKLRRKRSSSWSEKGQNGPKNIPKCKSLSDKLYSSAWNVESPCIVWATSEINIENNRGVLELDALKVVTSPASDVTTPAGDVTRPPNVPSTAANGDASAFGNSNNEVKNESTKENNGGKWSIDTCNDIVSQDGAFGDSGIKKFEEVSENSSKYERKGRDASGSGHGSGRRSLSDSAPRKSREVDECDSTEFSDKTDENIDDLPDDTNFAGEISKSEIVGVQKAGKYDEKGEMAMSKMKKWFFGEEENDGKAEKMEKKRQKNQSGYQSFNEDQYIAALELSMAIGDVINNDFDKYHGKTGQSDDSAGNSSEIGNMGVADVTSLDDIQNPDEAARIRSLIVESLLNEEGYKVDGENIKMIILCVSSLQDKYSHIDFNKLLLCNEKKVKLVKTFAAMMSKRAIDCLLVPHLRDTNLNFVYLDTNGCYSVKGCEKYLRMMGYERQDGDCFQIPEGKEVDRRLVAELALDFLILQEELDNYIYNTHPHQRKVKEVMDREEIAPDEESEPEKVFPSSGEIDDLPGSNLENVSNQFDTDMFSRRQGTGSQWLPETKKIVQESLRPHHCDLCGSTAPAVRCDKCANQVFCMSCDDMFHRHPKRKSHNRKAVDPSPLPPPRPPSKFTSLAHPPQPPPRRNKKPIEKKPELPRKESVFKSFLGGFKGRPLPPSPTKTQTSPVQSPTIKSNQISPVWAYNTGPYHRGADSLMTDSGSRHSSGSSAGPNPSYWPQNTTQYPVPDPGSHNMELSSSDVEDDVTRVCGADGMAQRGLPNPRNRYDTLPQPNVNLARRHTFLDRGDISTLDSRFSGRSSLMQHSTSTSDIQSPTLYQVPQQHGPGMGYQSMANLHSLSPPGSMHPFGPICTCNGPFTQDMHGNLHRTPCPMHSYVWPPEQPGPFLDKSSTLQRGFGSGYSLNYMGPMGPVSFIPIYPQHMLSPTEAHVPEGGSRVRAPSPTSSVASSRMRKAKSEAAGLGQGQSQESRTRSRRRRKGGIKSHQKNTSSEEDYFSPGGSDDDDFRSIRSSARSPESRTWQCEHCTFRNAPGTNICGVCCKTSSKPKVAARKTMQSKAASEIDEGALSSPKATPQPKPRSRFEAPKERTNGVPNVYDELPAPRSVAPNPDRTVEQIGERLQGLSITGDDSSSKADIQVSKPISVAAECDLEYGLEAPTKKAVASMTTSPPKQLISTGTSPPPRTISTQTPSSVPNPIGNWHPLDGGQPQRNPSHVSGVLPRSSSRLSLSGDMSSSEIAPLASQLRRASSIQAGPSGGFGSNVPWSSPGTGYRGYRTSSRGSSGSEMGYSPPLSPRASSPVAVMTSQRREKRGRHHHQDTQQDSRYRGSGSSRQDYYQELEELVERRRHETMKAQGLELVKMLREAETHHFTADDLQIALHHCGNNQNPVRWLEENLRNMMDTVVTLATNFGHDRKDNDIGIVSTSEAKDALRIHKGNVWAAVTECVELRQKKYAELKDRGNFTREEIVAALTSNQGNVERAFADLNKASLKPFLMRIWGPPTGAENEASPTRPTVSPPQTCLIEPVTTVIQSPLKMGTEELQTLVYESDTEDFERLEQFEDAVEDADLEKLDYKDEETQEEVVALEPEEPRVPFVPFEVHTSSLTIDIKPVETESTGDERQEEETLQYESLGEEHPVASQKETLVTPTRQLEFERKVRKLLAERRVTSYEKAELAARLLEQGFEELYALEAAAQCGTLSMALSYLEQHCDICFTKYPESQMVSMLQCEHRCCHDCASGHFTTLIRNQGIMDLKCPFCNQPSNLKDEEIFNQYFAHLDILLRKLVTEEVHELFQQKLRDWTLQKQGNFKWCSKCGFGYGVNPEQKRYVCPDCHLVTCALCDCKWEKQHDNSTCEEFALWKKDNDPEFQAEGLEKHLSEHGIRCPHCKSKYSLAKGGCIHFTCPECKYEFCSGCGKPFAMGERCSVGVYCGKLGLHAHHPRNCLFFLRDKTPEELQKLLDESKVAYNTEATQNTKCLVNIQKEDENHRLVDEHCGQGVEDKCAGLCRLHYIEYLVGLINRNNIDPVGVIEGGGLTQELVRHEKEVPERAPKEADEAYDERLRELIQSEIPLEDVFTPTRA